MDNPGIVLVSLGLLAAASLFLGLLEFRRYRDRRGRAHLFWAVGLFLVTLTLLQETYFYAGAWSQAMVRSYLFLVALLVGILSLGSAEGGLGVRARTVYAAYVVLGSAVTGIFCLLEPVSPGIVVSGIVSGNPPLGIVLASTAVTVPAAGLMIITSLTAAYRTKKWRLASITAGILVISIAGGLYIVSFPVTLYYAEFAGVFLLFLGFGGFEPVRALAPAPSAA